MNKVKRVWLRSVYLGVEVDVCRRRVCAYSCHDCVHMLRQCVCVGVPLIATVYSDPDSVSL